MQHFDAIKNTITNGTHAKFDGSEMGSYARTILKNKRYVHEKHSGYHEEWREACDRVVGSVMQPYMPPSVCNKTLAYMYERKFIPGGRYLYASGRKYHQINSCFLFSCMDDTKEEWGRVMDNSVVSLMTGGGVGVVYSKLRCKESVIKGMGGSSSGPCALMKMINESGRYIFQGGSRRSALWAGLHWDHADIEEFICMKDWTEDVKYCKSRDFNFPAPMDGTNISVILNTEFFESYDDPTHPKHKVAHKVYWMAIRHMLETGEPGFSIDTGENEYHNLRNAPVVGDTKVLTMDGYKRVVSIVDTPTTVWTGKQWAEDVVFKKTGENTSTVRVALTGGREIVCDPSHPFLVEIYNGYGRSRFLSYIDRIPASELEEGDIISVSLPQPEVGTVLPEVYTLGFLYGDGTFTRDYRAEVAICIESKKICAKYFSSISHTKSIDGRGYNRYFFKGESIGTLTTRSKEVCPDSLSPTWSASFLAGLFDADGNIDPIQKRIRLSSVRREFLNDVSRMLESLGILSNISKGGPSGYGGRRSWQLVVASDYMSRFMEVIPTLRVRVDLNNYHSYRKSTIKVISVTPDVPADVYCADVRVEEHSFQAEGVLISNCTELNSNDDLDCCNLGSINLGRIGTIEEFMDVVESSIALLLCGTLYSKLPVEGMYRIREKNRRLGLGLMGIHEWLLKRGYSYEANSEIAKWLEAYQLSGEVANKISDGMGISRPVATRAIAPNGTISIIGETTGGIEPIMAVAYKRRYLEGTTWRAQYVVDPVAHRLINDSGINPDDVQDAYSLSEDVGRRIEFQRFVQRYVDHGIASTINLPEWGSSLNNSSTVENFGNTLYPQLPGLRGITVYPNNARSGQPFVRSTYREAIRRSGVQFDDGGSNVSNGDSEQGRLEIEKLTQLHESMTCKDGICGI